MFRIPPPTKIIAIAGCVIASFLTGCACPPTAATQPSTRTEGTLNAPVVISGSPKRDGRAFNESEKDLGPSDFTAIEKCGPKPLLLVGSKDEKPGTAITQAPVVEDTELPLKIVDLPDGKVRLIWTLRSFGGASVISTRDNGNSRRNVAVTPPDLAPIVTILTQQVAPGGGVVPIPATNTLVVTCDAAQKKSVIDMLSKLDVPVRQVEITAKIFEVSHDFDFQQGADLLVKHLGSTGTQTGLSTFDTQRFLNATNNPANGPFQGSIVSLMQTAKDAGLSVDVSLQLLAEAGLVKVVSSPRMTVAVGQTGYLLAGQELPIQSANIVNNALQTTTTYKPVGVQLYITPEAVGPKRVKLHTISVVSSIAGFTPLPTLTGGNNSELFINPIIDSREAETQVTVDNGATMVISGLRMIRQATRENKVPGLGDIPIFGWLFKNHREQQQMTDLYFFVTPTLM